MLSLFKKTDPAKEAYKKDIKEFNDRMARRKYAKSIDARRLAHVEWKRKELCQFRKEHSSADDAPDGKSILLGREEIIEFWKTEYDIDREEAEEILLEYEIAGGNYKFFSKGTARLFPLVDFINYREDYLAYYDYNFKYLIASPLNSQFFNDLSEEDIKNISSVYKKEMECQEKIEKEYAKLNRAIDYAKSVVQEAKDAEARLRSSKEDALRNAGVL